MAPTPKPPGQRVRRNAAQPQWRTLPREGRQGDAPDLPDREWLPSTLEWWRQVWASPMAVAYEEADVESLVRLARLKDDFDKGDIGTSALPAMQQLEDRFGLSPKARRALQWEVAQAEEAAPKPRRSRPSHLKAV